MNVIRRSPTWFQRFLLPGFAFKAVVIGGGYATGRELAEFFMPAGPVGGICGMLLAMAIWSTVCVVAFALAHALSAYEYRSLFQSLLGPAWPLFEILYLPFLVLILAVMSAAAGAIGAAVLGWPLVVGTLLLMAAIAGVTSFGNSGAEGMFRYTSTFLYLIYAGTPSPAQMTAMKQLVATAMKEGAFGISSALIYPPESFQSTEDLIALAKVVSQCDGFYATHIRDESGKLLSALDEASAIGEQGGVKVEIFHLKAAYAPGWGKLMPQAVAKIAAARARGIDIAADLYPYTAGGTSIEITVPNHLFKEGAEAAWKQLRDPRVREELKKEVASGSQPGWSNLVQASGGWDHVVLANAFNPKYARFEGQSLAAIGKALGKDPADAAWDILLEALPKHAMVLFFFIDERDIETALKQPWTSIGTDAAATEKFGEIDALGLPHPRAYGTFPRVIAEYVRERHVLTLEDAVRKMTSWPAERMGLSDRGLLREGLRADLVVFDYDKIQDVADFKHPTLPPAGIEKVIVNGQIALDDGTYTGTMSGMVLRHRCPD